MKRFKNEIWFCEHNNHPNVVKVLDHGCLSLDGITYVFCVMPRYFESLRDKINKTIQPEDAIAIFVGLLSGLKFAHEKDVVHRDIKPENIMFAKGSNEPVICDFGIAHFSENELMTFVETKPTDRLANFAYAAPEQRKKGGVAVPQTDLFAAGLILNEMFTKSVPQGSGYRTIKDVAPNYAFLDKIVERLYRNVPQERLFPEDKIISEMKVLAEIDKNEKEARRLRAIVNETTLPEVIDLKVEDEKHTWICEGGRLEKIIRVVVAVPDVENDFVSHTGNACEIKTRRAGKSIGVNKNSISKIDFWNLPVFLTWILLNL